MTNSHGEQNHESCAISFLTSECWGYIPPTFIGDSYTMFCPLWICEVKTITSHLWDHLLGKFQDPRPQMDLS